MAGLTVLHLVSYVPWITGAREDPINLLNMDGEQNLTSLFSSALLWIAAGLLGSIASVTSEKKQRMGWMGLAVIFLFLGVDEFASLHERLGGMVDRFVAAFGLGCFAWVIPYGIFLILLVVTYIKFLWRLPLDTRTWLIVAGAIYVGGALGFEIIGGAWFIKVDEGWVYQIFVTCEELLEMTGSIVFIQALFLHIERHMPPFSLRITSS